MIVSGFIVKRIYKKGSLDRIPILYVDGEEITPERVRLIIGGEELPPYGEEILARLF